MPEGPARQAAIAAALAVLHLVEVRKEASRQAKLAEATEIVARAIEQAAPAQMPRIAIEPSNN